MVMAEVTAALVTFSDAAICGSDGRQDVGGERAGRGKAGQNGDLQDGRGGLGAGRGVDRGGLVGHGGFPGLPNLDDIYHIKWDGKATIGRGWGL